MRKLILRMQISLDGYVGGPQGELDWIFASMDTDGEYTEWSMERLWQAGAHLMGSNTYRDMAAHWPTSNEPFAAPMNEIPKIVFSSSLTSAGWSGTRIVPGDLAGEVTRLKAQPGGDLLAHGGAQFAQSLVRTGLIDEYHLFLHPIALGRGLSLFPDDLAAPIALRPVTTAVFGSGVIARILHPA